MPARSYHLGSPEIVQVYDPFDVTFAVNVRAPMITMQGACRHWIDRGSPGAIVNIASANAFQNESPESIYNASKAALVALTKAFAHEMGHHGIVTWDPR